MGRLCRKTEAEKARGGSSKERKAKNDTKGEVRNSEYSKPKQSKATRPCSMFAAEKDQNGRKIIWYRLSGNSWELIANTPNTAPLAPRFGV